MAKKNIFFHKRLERIAGLASKKIERQNYKL
jgi:hypothetical protein